MSEHATGSTTLQSLPVGMINPAREVPESPLAHLDFLYPPIAPHRTGLLEVGEGHRVYWEESGNAEGMPAIFLHGGPGGASRSHHRQFFDPDHFRFVTMHQRGCGNSTPLAETRGNTTQALIADLETLREALDIEKWLVVGGSWGTTLGLAYGEAHPKSCLGFVLSGVTLGRDRDQQWWWDGTRRLFPEAFDAVLDALPNDMRQNPMAGMHALLGNSDPAVHMPAARALTNFSAATTGVVPSPATTAAYEDPAVSLPLARLFVHYCANGHFLEADQLLLGIERINGLPCKILAGRRDVTTPPECAWLLHKAWPGSVFAVQEDTAHSLADAPAALAYLAAIEAMKGLA